MRATPDIMQVWNKFKEFPMETLTKAWYHQQNPACYQRSVELMKQHRDEFGTSGNCFDLAIWLIDEFRRDKMDCYAIVTPDSHVAVVALNEKGERYLCDLGDLWIEPILIERESVEYTEEFLAGFFPGAHVKLTSGTDSFVVTYQRPKGKLSQQEYFLRPVSDEELRNEGESTQRSLWNPLVEKRIYQANEVIHWEFCDHRSQYSSMNGLIEENELESVIEWAERISHVSGIHMDIVSTALEVYGMKRG